MKNNKKHIFSKDQETFIRKNYNLYSSEELKNVFNKMFDCNLTYSSIRSKKQKLGLNKKIKVVPIYNISKKEEIFLITNYKDLSNEELTLKFNSTFNKNLTIYQIKHLKKKLKITEKGKGRRVPLYHERRNHDGYTIIKIKDSKNKYYKNYVLKSHYIWEQHYGEIPKGYNLIYLDGNKNNCNIDNLVLIKNSELVYINHNMKLSKHKDINETSLLIAKLMGKTKEKAKQVI